MNWSFTSKIGWSARRLAYCKLYYFRVINRFRAYRMVSKVHHHPNQRKTWSVMNKSVQTTGADGHIKAAVLSFYSTSMVEKTQTNSFCKQRPQKVRTLAACIIFTDPGCGPVCFEWVQASYRIDSIARKPQAALVGFSIGLKPHFTLAMEVL